MIAGAVALAVDRPWTLHVEPQALFAVLWLGFLGSGLAYLIFFRLLARRGAAGTSLVAYLLPVFGVALGAIFLREPVDARLLTGLALIVGGIALVNMTAGRRPSVAPPPGPAPVVADSRRIV